MSDQKVIFIDVDGTLVSYENRLPVSARDAIRQARKNGHRVYICTGRSEAEVYPEIWEIGLDGMIGGNGAYVRDGDQVILHQTLTPEQCRRVVDWCHARGLEFYLECNSGLYASEHFEERANPTVKLYAARKGKDADAADVHSVFPDMIFGADLCRDDVNKISFILDSCQDHLDSIQEFPDLKAGTWGGAGEIALFGDLGVRGIDKGYAVDVLLRHLGASIDDTLAFGDAKADIPMLEKCAVGIAMGNGGEEIRAMADYVTDAAENDGIRNAFRHYHLI